VSALVLLDADVLGRKRTGEETYVANLLRELPALTDEVAFVAVTRHPELVPDGVEAIHLPARSQEVRMAWTLPRLIRRVGPDLAHFQHAIPLRCPCPAVVTIHDLSFEREPKLLGPKDRFVFRTVVPRAARKAVRLIAVSERTKADLVELYKIPPDRITVAHHGIDPAFTPAKVRKSPNPRPPSRVPGTVEGGPSDGYALFVGSIQARKDPLAAADAAKTAGLRLVVAGPTRDPELARELERRGADLRGYLDMPALADLYRGAACLVLPSRYEGFGLPVLEAMACGTPVVAAPEPALREVAGDAALYAAPGELPDALRQAVRDHDRLAAAGLERAKAFSWRETARSTLEVYRDALGAG
jgi:glycosyltransferase involved in cell wall biosynthesis